MRRVLLALVALCLLTPHARAIDESHKKKADDIAAKAIAYLRAQQDKATGGWAVNPQGPAYPAITGLVLSGLLMQPGVDEKDDTVKAAIAYILKYRQPDGGLYDTILPSYNTSICLSALARVNTPEAKAVIKPAQDFLKSLQFGEAAATTGAAAREAQKVGKDHPFYGGVGYGRSGRPDLSNTAFFIEALRDSGVPADDPAIQRTLVFLKRVQMDGRINDMPYAKDSRQGGFIYSTSESKDKVGTGQSEVTAAGGMIEETLDDGTKVSRLRAYGSMTYSGFKSLIYANLSKNDPRVQSALGWMQNNYTLEENPGIGKDGLYYYILVFARALEVTGQPSIDVLAAPARLDPTTTLILRRSAIDPKPIPGKLQQIKSVTTMGAMEADELVQNDVVVFETPEAADHWEKKFGGEAADQQFIDEWAASKSHFVKHGRYTWVPCGSPHDWANDLIDRLAELQNDDGSFKSVGKRWLEDNPVLITAYALLALQHAARPDAPK